ncbi:MAG: hypothetical protein PHQ91_15755 [Thermoanaerobaculaceae bacterium]|nr:hypothetical protein [Thermoanaerobaculaceae bacterium]TAM54410.1 MAG: hypothetical protein EPN53_04265 [Acidobacteriota bacterium]
MAAPARLTPLLVVAAAIGLAAAALWVPARSPIPPAAQPPEAAAERAERELPSLGLPWGKVRGWERVNGGWTVTWQPAHGMWLVRVWVPDGPGEMSWRIDAASWLPGVRLSRRAARALTEGDEGVGQARERLGRRDWLLGDARLVGALPAGGELPTDPRRRPSPAGAVLAGLLLAGAAARHLVPGVPSRRWRQAVSWSAVALVPLLPQLSAVAPAFRAGVRPWVGELAFGGAAILLLGALVFGAQRFAAVVGRPLAGWLAVGLAAGVVAGRLQPAPWLLGVAALPLRLPALMALAVLLGWLMGLAGDGLRELARPVGRARPAVFAALGVAAVAFAGPWLGVALAVVAAAAVERGSGTGMAVAGVWGWVFGSVWALAEWEPALRDALALLLVGVGTLAAAGLAPRTAGASSPAIEES